MTDLTQTKILILSCGTGEGHNSAAKAIEASLKEKGVQCEVRDALAFKSERTSRGASSMYNFIIRKTPAVFGMCWVIGAAYDNTRLPSPIYAWNSRYSRRLRDYIVENGFTCVICTHLFAMASMTAVRKKLGLDIKCYGVLTDYTTIPFYKDSDLDGYFVSHERVALQLKKKRFADEKIFRTGIPVHPKFNGECTKSHAREQLGIPQDKKVVAVLAGGVGSSKIVKICRKLNKALNDDHLIIAFPGRNEKQRALLDKKFGGNPKFRIVAFSDELNIYLKAVDVAISKAGGLSSTEIAVSNVPLVHFKTVPCLETANIEFFTRNGLSLRAKTARQAIDKTLKLLADDELARAMCENQRRVVKSDATEKLVERVLGDCVAEATAGDAFAEDHIAAAADESVG